MTERELCSNCGVRTAHCNKANCPYERTSSNITAWAEGVAAGRKSPHLEGIFSNPHIKGTEAARDWDVGFTYGYCTQEVV